MNVPKKASKAKPTGKDKAKASSRKSSAVRADKSKSKPKAAKTLNESKTKGKAPKAKPETAAVESKKKKAIEADAAKTQGSPADDKKPVRKGITIVSPKPMKRPKGPATVSVLPAGLGRLLDPKGPARKPLIPSGPKAVAQRPLGQHGGSTPDTPILTAKSPFGKKELEHFRTVLLRKRAELVGDVSTMETQALRGESGSLSNMPSHLAEQGSEAYDQSLSLDLAAADRKLIREIDDALKRIAEGTFGICELTGKPIKMERLEELPWAKYSIEAARELERQSMRA